MTPGEAKRWIARLFGPRVDLDKVTDETTAEDFVRALQAVERVIPFPDKRQNRALKWFLWAGCRKFDRWFVPTPFVVPPDQPELFVRFVRAFAIAEKNPENVGVFEIHAVRDHLYRAFDCVNLPLDAELATTLEQISEEISETAPPKDPTKLEEFNKEQRIVAELASGLRDADLYSCCTFLLPYPIVKRPLSFALTWQGLRVEGAMHPEFLQPPHTLIQSGSLIASKTPTRWQYGKTNVSLRFPALIDHSAHVPPLQLPQEPPPVPGWPQIFSVVFGITYEVSWKLRNDADSLLVWVPSPSDLGGIEFWIETQRDKRINWMKKDNPALGHIVFNPITEPRHIEFGSLVATEWHNKCRVLAVQYLASGDTREALFWLNVGIEAFIADKIVEIAANNSEVVNFGEIRGAASYWDEAKALIAAKFPEFVDEIDWPTPVRIASVFAQLKRLSKSVTLSEPVDRIIAHYQKIQHHRSALFHGENADAIPAEKVGIAIEGFDWLVECFGTV